MHRKCLPKEGHYDFDNRYCPSSEGIFAVHTPIKQPAHPRIKAKYYPKAIIDYANSRGADKVLYAGYFPMGLSLERIFSELPMVPLKDEVWPKFLYGNAARILGLES